MDETAIAFEMPHARAAATQQGQSPDRISVRDYTRSVEIGAFRTERGTSQRIRFNVVLEVSHHTAAQDDDVDKVISYDTITEAIEAELAAERVNLLETLAERVAARCLSDPRAVRVFVRIEKLDRGPGALGVEIMRARLTSDAPRLRPVAEPRASLPVQPRVVFLPDPTAAELEAIASAAGPTVLCLAPHRPCAPATSEALRRIGLLAIEQAAWAVTDRDPRFSVADSRTELDWALRNNRLSIWAPCRMVMDSHREAPDASDPAALAAWLAAELGADF